MATETLCWHCNKVGNGCHKPVEGWVAEYRPVHGDPSWRVIECPEFEPDSRIQSQAEKELARKLKMKEAEAYKAQAVKNGISGNAFMNRISQGWTIEEAMTTPTYKESARTITYKGETKTLSQWSELTGIHTTTLASRLNAGWPPERILETPSLNDVTFKGTDLSTGETRIFHSIKQAAMIGFNSKCVRGCLTGKQLRHMGWTFEIIEEKED